VITQAVGAGVLRDNVSAHMWLSIAASDDGNDELARKGRDKVAEDMTSAELAEAQRLARECVKKEYKNC
jgi:hypothetical protein